MLRKRLKGLMAYALAFSMVLPAPIAGNPTTVEAKVINTENDKEILWSTSFETDDKFKSSTLDEKGTANVTGKADYVISGVLTNNITDYSGSAAANNNEVLGNLFDGDSGSKYLTNNTSPEIIVKLKEARVIKAYVLTSANDKEERDPKNWILEGRNSDKEGWTWIDEQNNQKFSGRKEQRYFNIGGNNTAYSQYRLRITANNGATDYTQLSDFVLTTAEIKAGEQQNQMVSVITGGPKEAWNQRTNCGWSGISSLLCLGKHEGNGHAYSNNVIYEDLNIPVSDNTNLKYVIFPSMSNGEVYDFEFTQMHMAVDLKFTDGTYLSDLGAIDQNGDLLNAKAQGESRTLLTQQWNEISSNIGKVAAGKTIDDVLVVYDMESHEDDSLSNFQTYFDDIEIYNQATPVYDHLSDYVYILRGSNGTGDFSTGLTAPAVTVPNGFNFWTPSNEAGSNTIYHYQKTDTFRYIQASHEPSIWVGDRGTWQFMINTSKNSSTNDNFGVNVLKSKYSHENEVAKAHYYKIKFDEDGGDAANSQMEITPTSHGAVVQFTYDNDAANHSVVFDCIRDNGGLTYDGKTFTAYSDHTSNGSKRMYVYGEFSENPTGTKVDGKKGIATFNSNQVTMKVATSYISYDQAKKNLELEIGNDGFNEIYNKSQALWDEQLSIITDVKGASYDQLVTLYSCIYRMYCYPNLMSENTGTKENPVWKYKSPYRDGNADPVDGKIYINNGFWDTYRTAWAAYGLFTPSKETEMLNGLVQHYRDQGWVPRWIAPGGTDSMVGTSSDVIFADAMVKGITFDYENAYDSALRNAATVSDNLVNGGRRNLNEAAFIGYQTYGGDSLSWAIEGYINDYGIAQMAKTLANKTGDATKKANYMSEYQYYLNRSKNYTLLFDAPGLDVTTMWLRQKRADGSLTEDNKTNGQFDPLFWGNPYTETNGYNMAVSVPQDGIGLANLYGGREQLANKIDTIFTTEGIYNGYGATNGVGGIHEQREAREVKLGQYGHSNQPSHHIPYMYLYSSRPWETQKYVRDILDRCYAGATFGQGYIGDEDNGEMSAWYVLSSIGFYPLSMGTDKFAIGSPLFEEVTVNLENNKKLVVKANNNSYENVYVDSMKVNGEEYDDFFISYDVLENGGIIEFNMSAQPNKSRVGKTDKLANITTGDNKPQVYKDFTSQASTDGTNGADALNNLYDNNSDTETKINNSTTLMFTFKEKKAVRMLTLTSAGSARTPDKAQLYGDNGDNNWQLLGEYNDNDKLNFRSWGKYTRPFAIDADKVANYSRYRLVLTGTDASLSEVELLGYEGDSILKSDLKYALDQANNYEERDYQDDVATSARVRWATEKFESAKAYAQQVYDNAASTDDQIKEAYQKIVEIYDLEERDLRFYNASHIEAERFDEKADAIVDDGTNIGGVKRNTWVAYNSVCFANMNGTNNKSTEITLNYAADQNDAGGYAEIYLDDRAGEPIGTIELPTTGEGWDNYKSVTAQLNSGVTGIHNLYIVFKNDGNHEYVANVDWIEFTSEEGEYDKEDPGETEYTVTFDSNGGTKVKSQTVAKGNKATKPEDPTKEGYTFEGWFEGDAAYNFDVEVTQDVNLTARWKEVQGGTSVEKEYTVTFNSNGGSVIDNQTIKEGESIAKPEDPTKEGYTFEGWYLDDELYDFKAKVTKNLVLVAKWNEDSSQQPGEKRYTVTFDSVGGSLVKNQTVKEGEKVNKPADPTKTGYVFKGWYVGEEAYNFEKAVTDNIMLIAKWETESQEGKNPGDDEGKNPGDDEGKNPGDDEGKNPGDDEGKNPGNDQGKNPGDDQGKNPGDDQGKNPGDDEGKNPGDDQGKNPGGNQGNNQEPTNPGPTNPGTNPVETPDANLKEGVTFEAGKLVYKITKVTADAVEVQVLKPVKKTNTSITIPNTVSYSGKECKVTSIAKNAFKNNKKLKKVTISANVVSIGEKAFYNCKKLNQVTFKKNKLKSVGKNAFLKTAKNLKIKTGSKSNIKEYSKLLKKKVPAKAKITK